MIVVSDAYKEAIKSTNRVDKITGRLTVRKKSGGSETYDIDDSMIIQNSLKITEQICGDSSFEIGTFFTKQLDISLIDEDAKLHNYHKATIRLQYNLLVGDDEWEQIPLGYFKVDGNYTKRKNNIVSIVGFDTGMYFDTVLSSPGGKKLSVGNAISSICSAKGYSVDLHGLSHPNLNVNVDLDINSQIQSNRDALEYCLALVGSSGRMNRSGNAFEVVRLNSKIVPDLFISGDERVDTEFNDSPTVINYATTTYKGISWQKKLTSIEADIFDSVLEVKENPLLLSPGITDPFSVWEKSVANLEVKMYEARFKFIGNPALECFDTVVLTGGNIDINAMKVFPTKIVWNYRGFTEVVCAVPQSTESEGGSSSYADIPTSYRSKSEKRIDAVESKTTDVKLNYTTGVDFNANGFNEKYDVDGTEYVNNWNWQTSGSDIIALKNNSTGRIIAITGLETADEFLTVAEIDEIWAEVIAE